MTSETKSVKYGIIVTIFSVIILALVKPKFITRLDWKGKSVIDWKNAVIISFLLGILTAVIVYLRSTEKHGKMSFSESY